MSRQVLSSSSYHNSVKNVFAGSNGSSPRSVVDRYLTGLQLEVVPELDSQGGEETTTTRSLPSQGDDDFNLRLVETHTLTPTPVDADNDRLSKPSNKPWYNRFRHQQKQITPKQDDRKKSNDIPAHIVVPATKLSSESEQITCGESRLISCSSSTVSSIALLAAEDERAKEKQAAWHKAKVGVSSSMEDPPSIAVLVSNGLWSANVETVRSSLREILFRLSFSGRHYSESRKKGRKSPSEPEYRSARHEVVLLGGHLSLLFAMRSHLQDPDIQIWGCKILVRLFNAGINVHHWNAVLGTAMGAMHQVVRILETFPMNLQVLEATNRLLSSLLRCKCNVDLFCKLEGVQLLMAHIERFPTDTGTQLDACRVFKKLCAWDDIRQKLVALGTVTVVANVIDHCTTCSESELAGTGLMKTFTGGGETVSTAVSTTSNSFDSSPLQLKISSDTIMALVSPANGVDVQSWRSSTPRSLHRLRRGESAYNNRQRSISTFVHPALPTETEGDKSLEVAQILLSPILSIDLWSGSKKVVRRGLEKLIDVLKSDHEPCCQDKALIEVGMPLAILKTAESYRRSKSIQRRLNKILATLLRIDGVPTIMGRLGAVELVLASMKRHKKDSKMFRDFARVLSLMAKGSRSNAKRLSSRKSLKTILGALDSDATDLKAQRRLCELLCVICSTIPGTQSRSSGNSTSCRKAVLKAGGAVTLAAVLDRCTLTKGETKKKSTKKTAKACKHALKAMLADHSAESGTSQGREPNEHGSASPYLFEI